MENLLEEAERILTSNIPCQLDPITKEILTISILGVILVKGQVAINKLPNALKSLQVISDRRSIINIMHEELGNYQEDELVLNADASMTRTIEYKDNKFQEQRTMIISLKDSDISYINLVALAMHELFHLLRFGGIEESQSNFIISDGISYALVDKNLKLKRRKHYYLEEGIVEELTHEGIDQLKIFLEDCIPLKGSILDSCKYELANVTYEYHGHDLARELVHILNKDQEFKNKVYQTDTEHDRPCQAAKYYDKVTGIGSFNILSKKFDSLIKEFESTQGEIDESTLDFKLKDILSDIRLFINKGIKNKIHIKNSNQ